MLKRFRRSTVPLACALCLLASAIAASSAFAATEGTGWAVSSGVYPTYLAPGASGDVHVLLVPAGASPSSGPITVTDTLPPGISATKAGGLAATTVLGPAEEVADFGGASWECTGNGSGERNISGATVVTCESNPELLPSVPGGREFFLARVGIDVKVEPGTPERVKPDCVTEQVLCNQVTVEGGGAIVPTRSAEPVTISSSEPGFGFPTWDVSFTNADGTPDTQAGSHPYETTFFLGFNELAKEVESTRMADGEVRNLNVDLPPGLFGDPTAVPRCSRAQFDSATGQSSGHCPPQSQIGVQWVGAFDEAGGGNYGAIAVTGVYNLVPPPGVPFEFGLSIGGFRAIFDAGVHSGQGYGIVEHVHDIAVVGLDESILQLWGVPPESSHDAERRFVEEEPCSGECASSIPHRPLLTLPTACEGPQAFTVHGTATWLDPNAHAEATVLTHDNNGVPTGFTGCEHLSIDPSLSVAPDTNFADTPGGLTVEVKVPQPTLELPQGVVSATIKNTKVTLPEGVVINPGQAAGLKACSEAEANITEEGPSSCPSAAKVGTMRIVTPLLEGSAEPELEGNVYVLQSNPPNLRLLFTASGDGIYLKLPAAVHLNEATGQLETTLTELRSCPSPT
jgi:hypothetical protein